MKADGNGIMDILEICAFSIETIVSIDLVSTVPSKVLEKILDLRNHAFVSSPNFIFVCNYGRKHSTICK